MEVRNLVEEEPAMDLPSSSLETLREQYKVAVELYRHEDNLNWRKLNHLFYVTAGLWAVIGFQVKSSEPLIISPRFFLGMVSLIGLIVSFAFGVALWFGLKYLHSRKNAVIVIEEILVRSGGQRIVSPNPESMEEKRFIQISPTTWMLKLLPILIFIVWLITFSVIILRK